LAGSFTSARDVLPDPGNEDLTSDIRLNIKLTESWFGLTWAYKFTETIGIGISPYLLVRSHATNAQTLAQALTTDNKITMVLSGREFRYVNYRLLFKMGAAFDFDRITLGLTLTTPSIKIMGSGSTGFNTTVVGIDLNRDNIKDDFLAADYQEKLEANYKTPISLGLGLTYKFDNVRLYGSAEWFSGMAKYEVMRGEDFIVQSTEDTASFGITHELESVLNFGVGLEYIFSPKLKTYASFTTDFSAVSSDSDTNLSNSSWDIYHVMAGTDFTVGDLSFTLGLGYAYGNRMARPARGEGALEVKEFFEGILAELEYKYSSFKFILGFAF
jgi:long-subunit fatty acid transport protein